MNTTRPVIDLRNSRPKGSHTHETRPAYVTAKGDLVDASKYDAILSALSAIMNVTAWHDLTSAERRTLDKAYARVSSILPELAPESDPFGPY